MKPHFTIRFTGKSVKPETFSVEDLIELLREVQGAFKDSGGGDSFFSLVSITRKSAAFGFTSDDAQRSEAGLEYVLTSLATPEKQRTARQEKIFAYYEKVNRTKQCQTVFYDKNDKEIFRFRKKADLADVPQSVIYKEYMTIVGNVVDAGGSRTPCADIVTPEGKRVSVYGPRRMIQELGARLFQGARVEGLAEVDSVAGEVKIVEATGVYDYEPMGIADLFKELREQFGDKLGLGDKVNPVAFQRSMRD